MYNVSEEYKTAMHSARNTVDSLTTIRKLKDHGTEVYFEKEYIRTGGNPLFSRGIRLFLCRFVDYLSLKSALPVHGTFFARQRNASGGRRDLRRPDDRHGGREEGRQTQGRE